MNKTMKTNYLLPLGLGAVALAFLTFGRGSGSSNGGSSNGNGGSSNGGSSNGGGRTVSGEELDQAFVAGLMAHLNQCYEDGDISPPVSTTDSFVGKAVADAAALAQSYVDAIFCADDYVNALGMPEGPALQKVREDAGTITRGWIRTLRGANAPTDPISVQAENARAEAQQEGYTPQPFRDALLNLVPYGLGTALGFSTDVY